jgi:hypothetical protein
MPGQVAQRQRCATARGCGRRRRTAFPTFGKKTVGSGPARGYAGLRQLAVGPLAMTASLRGGLVWRSPSAKLRGGGLYVTVREASMLGRINFQYRCLHDVVIAYVDWHIETLEDLDAWYAQYEAYFRGRFPRKVDLILELSKFRLSPKVVGRFRELRNRILDDYTVRSYRVNEPPMERAMMYAGAVLNGGPANHYETIEAALAALIEDRENEDAADLGSMSRIASAERSPEQRPTQSPAARGPSMPPPSVPPPSVPRHRISRSLRSGS